MNKFKGNWLKPNNCKVQVKRLSAFDVETNPETGEFTLGSSVFRENGELNITTFKRQAKMKKFLLNSKMKGYYQFATNLEYDLGVLYYPFNNFRLAFNKGGLIYAKHIKHKKYWSFFDSLNHLKMGVEAMGKLVNIPKMEKPDFSNPDLEYLQEYNINDSIITLTFMELLQQEYNNLGATLKATSPASAMDLFKRKYLAYPLKQPYAVNVLFKAYYGGRCEAFQRGYFNEKFYYYDVNSLYPKKMLDTDFPHPNFLKTVNVCQKTFLDYEGISYISFSVGKIKYPILPRVYNVAGFDKLVFGIGENIKGWYTHIEIRKALELGYKLNKVYKTYYSTKTINIFKDYVTDLYGRRSSLKNEHSILEIVLKLMLNSLYGKFGQKNSISELVNISDLTYKELVELQEKLKPVAEGFFYIEKSTFASFTNPYFCSYVTGGARILMIDLFNQGTIYTDTDSIITTIKIKKNISDKLGDLKLEYKCDQGYFVKSKFYMLHHADGWKVVCKGVRRTDLDFMNNFSLSGLFESDVVSNKNLHANKIRESIKRKLPIGAFNEREKCLSLKPDGKRFYLKEINPFIENTNSRPIIMEA